MIRSLQVRVGLLKLAHQDWQFVRGSAVVGAGYVAARFLGMLFFIVVTWMYVPADYGFIRYTIAVAYLVGEIIFAGYPVALSRYLGKYNNRPEIIDTYFSNAIVAVLVLLSSVVAVSLLALMATDKWHLEILLVLTGLTVDAMYFGLLRGLGHHQQLATYMVSANLVKILLVVLAVYVIGNRSPWLVLIVFSYSYLLPIFVLERTRPSRIAFSTSLVSARYLTELTKLAIPMMASASAYGVTAGVDIVFLEHYGNFEKVAYYVAAKTLTMVFLFAPFGIVTVLLPKVASLPDARQVLRYLKVSLGLVSAVSAFLFLAILLGGDLVVRLIYPPEYVAALDSLYILSAGMALFSVYAVIGHTWDGIGRPIVPAATMGMGALVNVIANLYLIPPLGAFGAGLALVLAYFVALACLGTFTWLRLNHLEVC